MVMMSVEGARLLLNTTYHLHSRRNSLDLYLQLNAIVDKVLCGSPNPASVWWLADDGVVACLLRCLRKAETSIGRKEEKKKKKVWAPQRGNGSRQTDSDASALNFTICCFIAKRSAKEGGRGGGVEGWPA